VVVYRYGFGLGSASWWISGGKNEGRLIVGEDGGYVANRIEVKTDGSADLDVDFSEKTRDFMAVLQATYSASRVELAVKLCSLELQ